MDERGRIGKDDGDDIEADLAPGDAGSGGITARGANDVLLLVAADGAVGCAEIRGSPGFYFHEDYGVAIAGDDVDLRFAFIGAIIASYHAKSGVSQIAVSEIFATAAESGFGGKGAPLTQLAGGIA